MDCSPKFPVPFSGISSIMSAEDGVSALILLLVGLPAAGKSSLASRLQEIATLPLASSTSSLRVYLISYDKKFTEVIRKGDYPSDFFSSQLWQESREAAFRDVINCVKFVRSSTSPPSLHLIVVDDNNFYRSMRYPFYQLARDNGCGFAQIYCRVSLQEALRRNAVRGDSERVPEKSVLRMSEKLEEPAPERHKWEANTLVLDSSRSFELDPVISFIASCWSALPLLPEEYSKEEREADRAISAASLLHQLDIRIRRVISEMLADADDPKSLAPLLAKHKKVFLENIKGGAVEEILGREWKGDLEEALTMLTSAFKSSVG